MEIKLIQTKSDPFLNYYKAHFPLGILSIATYLKQKHTDLNIEVINGELYSEKKLLKKTDADIIGLSCNIMNYKNAIKLAERAKENGAKVVLGGPYANYFHDLILQYRNCFDAIVIGDGEKAFTQIVEGKPFKKINNLVFKKDKKIIHTPREILDLDKLPYPDRNLIKKDIITKLKDFIKKERIMSFYSQKGCPWKKHRGGCIFCARNNPYRTRNPENVWNELKHLHETFKVNWFYDISDSLTMDIKWLHEFAYKKPKNLDVRLNIWSRTSDITEKTIKILKKLNVQEVYLGVESGNNKILKNINKGTAVRQNLKAVRLLKKYKISCTLSFVFGLLGETKQTLKDTLNHARQLVNEGNVKLIVCSLMNPLPGSVGFEMLKEKTNIIYGDIVYFHELEEKWIEYFTHVNKPEVYNAIDMVLDLDVPYKLDRTFRRGSKGLYS